MPSLSSVRTRSMCCLLVSGFFTEITQQIHSLRTSGVITSHFARAAESEIRTFRKSAGTVCTAPGEIVFLPMDFILHGYAIRFWSRRIIPEMKSLSEVYRCSKVRKRTKKEYSRRG
jgi:hypothetical protein